MKVPAKITMAKPLLHEHAEKINEVIAAIEPIINAIGAGSVSISKAGANWIISGKSSEGGTGLPAGYTFEEFTVCDSGTPATRWWPTWEENPEA